MCFSRLMRMEQKQYQQPELIIKNGQALDIKEYQGNDDWKV